MDGRSADYRKTTRVRIREWKGAVQITERPCECGLDNGLCAVRIIQILDDLTASHFCGFFVSVRKKLFQYVISIPRSIFNSRNTERFEKFKITFTVIKRPITIQFIID